MDARIQPAIANFLASANLDAVTMRDVTAALTPVFGHRFWKDCKEGYAGVVEKEFVKALSRYEEGRGGGGGGGGGRPPPLPARARSRSRSPVRAKASDKEEKSRHRSRSPSPILPLKSPLIAKGTKVTNTSVRRSGDKDTAILLFGDGHILSIPGFEIGGDDSVHAKYRNGYNKTELLKQLFCDGALVLDSLYAADGTDDVEVWFSGGIVIYSPGYEIMALTPYRERFEVTSSHCN